MAIKMQTLDQQLIQLRALLTDGQQQTAINMAETIQQQHPGSQEVAWTLARLYQENNDLEHLQTQLDHIHHQFPDDIQALVQLANFHYRRKQNKTALGYIEQAEQLAPTDVQVLNHKSLILNELFRYNEAIDTLQKVVELDRADAYLWSNLGMLHQSLGLFEQAEGYYLEAVEMAGNKNDAPYNNLILLNHYTPHSSPQKIFNLVTRWERKYARQLFPVELGERNKQPGKLLRIGMISDGFRTHPVGQMITQVLEHLPKHEIELFAYSTNLKEDVITQRIKSCVEQWSTIDHLNGKQLAEQLANDQLDILFDLSGHMSGSRLHTLVMKPAPILVKWVGGLINTTGLSTMDYLLSDAVETPEGVDEWYTEKLIRMPHGYVCYEAPSYSHDVYSPPVLHNGYITLGCFNNPQKINAVVLEQWANIMHRLPNSRLFLKSYQFNSPTLIDNITATMAGFGITAERLIIEGPSNHAELLKAYNKVDIALDPWPYSGGLTTCEAMFMGVPVVTYPGPTFAGRHSATHLTNVGLGQLVANSWEEYCDLVVNLANDPENLANIRKHLRNALLESPLCDAKGFARHFSNAMRAIWQRYCEGKTPAALTLDAEGNCQFEDENQPVTLQLPTSLEQETTPAEVSSFSFNFTGQIIALEHGTTLAGRPHFRDFLKKGAMNYICLDPGGAIRNAQQLQHTGYFQHFPLTVLGDGSEMELALAVEAERSTTLPFAGEEEHPTLVSTTTVKSHRLDDIEGLENLDWLILDGQHHNLAILKNGEQKLANTLLIEVTVSLALESDDQASYESMKTILNTWGYRLITFTQLKADNVPDSNVKRQIATAVFIANDNKAALYSNNEKMKLAFLLHTCYDLKKEAQVVLGKISDKTAETYKLTFNESKYLESRVDLSMIIHELEASTLPHSASMHNLSAPLVVSLTSYPARFSTLHLTLISLLKQSVKPDELVLWIAYEDREKLPTSVTNLSDKGLTIKYCKDIKSYKKIIYTLKDYPSYFIAIADDDTYYPSTWLASLLDSYIDNKTIVAHRAHKIILNSNQLPNPYSSWEWEYSDHEVKSKLILPTGGGGVLYPPQCFYKDVAREDIFTTLCPTADDLWLYWMARLNDMNFKVTKKPFAMITWPKSQESALWHKNIHRNNDTAIIKLNEKYKIFQESFSVGDYWDTRYLHGGNSGAGSYGRLALFKAKIINNFISDNNIESIFELGCGDGNQCGLLKVRNYKATDISDAAINKCKIKYKNNSKYQFIHFKEYNKEKEYAELSLSLDVIYHLIEDNIYSEYMESLFNSTSKYCIIYSCNVDEYRMDSHVRKRKFTDWIEAERKDWELLKHIPNLYPYSADDPQNTSFADFYIFKKI